MKHCHQPQGVPAGAHLLGKRVVGPDLAREVLLGPEGPAAGYLQHHILLLPSKLPHPPDTACPSPRNTPGRTIGSNNLLLTLHNEKVPSTALMTLTLKIRVEA